MSIVFHLPHEEPWDTMTRRTLPASMHSTSFESFRHAARPLLRAWHAFLRANVGNR